MEQVKEVNININMYIYTYAYLCTYILFSV